MQNTNINVNSKYCLMLCELHYPGRHGKTYNSDPNIETHYLVYDRYDPITGISLSYFNEYQELDTDDDSDSDTVIEHIGLYNINNEITFLKNMYSDTSNFDTYIFGVHTSIRNYHSIISRENYIKPEIAEYIILPTQEAIAILKTFWLRIIQKKWKKIFQERKHIIRQRCNFSNLSIREMRGKWPKSCINLPSLKGMLSSLK